MIRRALVLAAVAVSGAGLLSASPAQAIVSCGHNWDCRWQWYSNSSYTQIVGVKEIDCTGNETISGRQTIYQTYSAKSCL